MICIKRFLHPYSIGTSSSHEILSRLTLPDINTGISVAACQVKAWRCIYDADSLVWVSLGHYAVDPCLLTKHYDTTLHSSPSYTVIMCGCISTDQPSRCQFKGVVQLLSLADLFVWH